MGTSQVFDRGMYVLVALCVSLTAALAQTPKDKPRVPPGVDPGGVAVAIIGGGIDYTRPEIAGRLARDGEGEIIGWDFVDNDRRPFYRCEGSICPPCTSTVPRDPGSGWPHKIITLRVSASVPQTLVQAVQAAEQMKARIIVLNVKMDNDGSFLLDAAKRYRKPMFVAELTDGGNPDSWAPEPDNVMAHARRGSRRTTGLIAWQAARLIVDQPQLNNAGVKNALGYQPWLEQSKDAATSTSTASIPIAEAVSDPGCPQAAPPK